jgi:hypothetical protein
MKFDLRGLVAPRLLGVGIICGLLGAAVDLDHLPRILTGKYIEPIYLIKGFFTHGDLHQGRPLHNLILIIACFVLLLAITLLMQYSVRSFAANFIAACKKTIDKYLKAE